MNEVLPRFSRSVGDYAAYYLQINGSYPDPPWIESLSWTKIIGAPPFEPALGNPDSDGQVLSSTAAGVRSWITPAGGGGTVSSVFTRTGAVVAATGDYTAAQVTNALSSLASYADPAWLTSLAWSKITGAPATGVSSVFTRTGAIAAVAGDYTAAQVTNALDSTQTYANPAWLTALAWTKITGAPAFITGNQTITLSGDVTGSGATAITATIAAATRANWDTAYSDRMKWDGGATSLVAATGRTSLGLGSIATHPTTDFETALGNPSTDGYILSSTGAGVRSWVVPPSAPVVSVFARTGAVVAAANDYNFNQLAGVAATSQGGLPTGGTASQVLSKNSGTNYDASWATLSGATLQTAVTSPAGTTSITGVMMGLGPSYAITPVRSGKVLLMISGGIRSSQAGGFAGARIYYGTGTPPGNQAVPAGTPAGANAGAHSSNANEVSPFTCVALVTGLTLNQAIWFDLNLSSSAGTSTASVVSVAGTAFELP